MKKFIIITLACYLFGCSSYQISPSPALQSNELWVIMPMLNYSNTPLAAEKAEQILHSLLFKQGIIIIQIPSAPLTDLASILDVSHRRTHANKWLQTQQVKYVISGSVEEWHYKNGLDGEPAVGVTLQITDLNDNKILWKATGSRAGWGRESLSATGQIVMNELLNQIEFEPETDATVKD